ncbi:transposase [Streptomyces sp. NPDC058629]|uniref:transposase n=1 Tax=Streptomyces sp. NPDC058629 TaxID=3346565 RepID=UPI003664B123
MPGRKRVHESVLGRVQGGDAIEHVRSSGRTVTEVARELGISSESLRGWVKKACAAQDAGSASARRAGQSAADRDEKLKRLRKLTAKTVEILGRPAVGSRGPPVETSAKITA